MPNIQLTKKTFAGEVILEINPDKAQFAVLTQGRCIAIFDLCNLWDVAMEGLIAVNKTTDIGLLRRTKEAKAVLDWRKNNL